MSKNSGGVLDDINIKGGIHNFTEYLRRRERNLLILVDGSWDNIKNDGEIRDEKQKITTWRDRDKHCDGLNSAGWWD